MRSFLQDRRLRKAVQAQLSQVEEKTVGLQTPTASQPNSGWTTPRLDDEGGKSIPSFSGIEVREQMATDGKPDLVFVVGWDGPNDPLKPHNWGTPRRFLATMMVSWIAFSVTATSSIDAAVTKQTSEAYHVGVGAASLRTGMHSPSHFFPFDLSEKMG